MARSQKDAKSIEQEIINFKTSFMKEKVGRGPRDVKVKLADNIMIILIYGMLSPLEKNILQSPEGEKVILEGRKLYLELTNPVRLAAIEKIAGSKIVDHYDHINVRMETGVSVIIFEENIV